MVDGKGKAALHTLQTSSIFRKMHSHSSFLLSHIEAWRRRLTLIIHHGEEITRFWYLTSRVKEAQALLVRFIIIFKAASLVMSFQGQFLVALHHRVGQTTQIGLTHKGDVVGPLGAHIETDCLEGEWARPGDWLVCFFGGSKRRTWGASRMADTGRTRHSARYWLKTACTSVWSRQI